MAGRALITGASSGFGVEFARLAAAEGYDLVLTARSGDRLAALATELQTAHGIRAEAIPADLARPGEADRLWQAARAGGPLDILVNNAGLGSHGFFGTMDPAREDQSLAVNILAFTTLLRHAARDFRAQGHGRILTLASLAAFMPGPNMAVYHATKSYVLSLSQAGAEELRGTGVTVTALCPGPTATGFFPSADVNHLRLNRLDPMAPPDRVAATGWRAMKAGRRVVIAGGMNNALAFATRFLPRRATARLAHIFMTKRD